MDEESALARVRVQATDFTCEASVHVAVTFSGYRSRVSDLLNENPRFLALTDVSLEQTSTGGAAQPAHHDVMLLRKDEIKFVIPLE
jgi:hypothetical protein